MAGYWGAILAVFCMMNIVFAVAIRLKRNDLADVIWGPGFAVLGLGAWLAYRLSWPGFEVSWRMILSFSLVCFWAFRLFYHLGLRTWKKWVEDIRYQDMRQRWGKQWKLNSYIWVFMLQGLIMLVVGVPVVEIFRLALSEFDFVFYLGATFWILGFWMESVADQQLKKFKENPANKGRVMDQGLWSWSRHPNYFGDTLQWTGIALVAFLPWSNFWVFVAPAVMTFLFLKVSGVPLLEKIMEGRPGWDEYKRRTSVFFPWPPRK
jgi:steroid 5-alpha reductase family enzyme